MAHGLTRAHRGRRTLPGCESPAPHSAPRHGQESRDGGRQRGMETTPSQPYNC